MVTWTFTPTTLKTCLQKKRALLETQLALMDDAHASDKRLAKVQELVTLVDDRFRWLTYCSDKHVALTENDLRDWGI